MPVKTAGASALVIILEAVREDYRLVPIGQVCVSSHLLNSPLNLALEPWQ